MSPSELSEASVAGRKLSWTAYLNALWSCYSPAHQMQHYYRVGVLPDCSGKWKDLFDCLNSKTKKQSELEEIPKTHGRSKFHIWSFRSPEESSAHWRKLFGHLDGNNDKGTAGSSSEPQPKPKDDVVTKFKSKRKFKKQREG